MLVFPARRSLSEDGSVTQSSDRGVTTVCQQLKKHQILFTIFIPINCGNMEQKWEPLSFDELYSLIIYFEKSEYGELLNLWNLIKINPEKWKEEEYGEEGGGFWVVAMFGYYVVWYNDIEEGFNISSYHNFGTIGRYGASQYMLREILVQLNEEIRSGKAAVFNA